MRGVSDERSVFYRSLRDQLRAYAEREFKLSATDDDGISYRKALEGLLKRARDPKTRARYESELTVPAFPKVLDYLWRVFLRLSRRRGSTGFGVAPISWSDIDAFVRNSGFTLAPWEVGIVEDLDDLFRASLSIGKKKPDDED